MTRRDCVKKTEKSPFRSGGPSVENTDAVARNPVSFSQKPRDLREMTSEIIARAPSLTATNERERQSLAQMCLVGLGLFFTWAGDELGERLPEWPALDPDDDDYRAGDAVTQHLELHIARCVIDSAQCDRLSEFTAACAERFEAHDAAAWAYLRREIPRFFGLAVKRRAS